MSEMFVIGQHISHSLSPAMWNHLFERTGRDVHYGRRDVTERELTGVLDELRSGSVLAANVTMPHKAWAASVADELDDFARSTGAANLLQPGAVLRGSNTDVPGARSLLEARAPFDTVLVLGAGGTAASLMESLVGLTTAVSIANRTAERARSLADSYARRFASAEVVEWEDRDRLVPDADLVINTIPLVEDTPVDLTRFQSHALLYDVVYRAAPTALQRQAAERGIPLTEGLAHLAAQAIAMLEPLSFDPQEAGLLVEGLELATGRPVTAWGQPLA